MSLSTGSVCVVCGEVGCDFALQSTVPIGIAGVPVGSGERKSGKFFVTTDRVWKNNRLVHGANVEITWEEAQHLGLVPTDSPVAPVPEEAPSTTLVETGAGELAPEPASTAAAAVRRRKPAAKKTGVATR